MSAANNVESKLGSAEPAHLAARRRSQQRRRTNARRAILALSLVAVAEVIGTIGFHAIEGLGWVNAFYFESMLATGQGPPLPLNTDTGKVFASIMGFVSVGSTLSAVIFTLGPILSRLWRELIEGIESEARALEQDAVAEIHKVEKGLR